MHLPALTLTTVLVSPAVDRLLAVALLVLGALVLLSIGPLGVLRDPAFIAYDLATFHTAGERLLAGLDPWRLAIEGQEPAFSYPPNAGALLVAYALLPEAAVFAVHSLISLLLLLSMGRLAQLWFLGDRLTLPIAFCLLPFLVNTHVAYLFYTGQITLIPVAAALWCCHMAARGRWLAAGILLGIAALKPQIGGLLLVWFAAKLSLPVIVTSGIVFALMCLPAIVAVGPVATVAGWLESLEWYRSFPSNQLGNDAVEGLPSLLAARGIEGVSTPLALVALLVPVLLARTLSGASVALTVSLLLGTGFVLVYAHGYDLSGFALFACFLLWCAFRDGRLLVVAGAGLLVLALAFPAALLGRIGIVLPDQWRTLCLILALGLAWVLERRARGREALERAGRA
ncbi:MAG: glycosyltransferase family 87 protein [Pseudomonadota bacterium]